MFEELIRALKKGDHTKLLYLMGTEPDDFDYYTTKRRGKLLAAVVLSNNLDLIDSVMSWVGEYDFNYRRIATTMQDHMEKLSDHQLKLKYLKKALHYAEKIKNRTADDYKLLAQLRVDLNRHLHPHNERNIKTGIQSLSKFIAETHQDSVTHVEEFTSLPHIDSSYVESNPRIIN